MNTTSSDDCQPRAPYIPSDLEAHRGADGKFCGRLTVTLWQTGKTPAIALVLKGSASCRLPYLCSGGAAYGAVTTGTDAEVRSHYKEEAEALVRYGIDRDVVMKAYSLIRQFTQEPLR